MSEKKKKNKEKVVSFRVDNESFKALEKLSKVTGTGTAHAFARDLVERVINRSGAIESWSKENETQE